MEEGCQGPVLAIGITLCLTALGSIGYAKQVYYEGEGYITPSPKSQEPFKLADVTLKRSSRQAGSGMITVNPLATGFPDIVLYTTVLDANGNPISGLTQADFTVTEQSSAESSAVTETITSFVESGTGGSRMSFSLVFDLSSSMRGYRLADAKTAATSFINNASPNDRGALVTFSSGGRERIVMQSNWIGTDADNSGVYDIIDAINELSASGSTAVYDGTAMGIDSLSQEPSPKAVIVFTDGDTNDDESYSINQVIEKANNEGVPLYTIGLGIDPSNLKNMAASTGGAYYYAPSAQDMAEIYNSIARSVRSQYTIGYTTHNPNFDGTTRTVTVQSQGNSGTGIYVVNSKPSITIDQTTAAMMNQSHLQGEQIPISGSVVDQDAVAQGQILSGTIYFRASYETNYHQKTLSLVDQGGGVYSYSTFIDAAYVSEPYVEFYLHVTDGIQNTSVPFNNTSYPFSIAVLPNHAPEIYHQPVTSAQINQPLTITAQVDEKDSSLNDSVSAVTLSYRMQDPYQQTPYITLNMQHDGGVNYSGIIPGDAVTAAGVEYYISAWDSFQTRADYGSAEQPNLISLQTGPQKSITITDQTKTNGIGIEWNQTYVFTWDSTGINTIKWAIHDGPTVAGQEAQTRLVYFENIGNTGSVSFRPSDHGDVFRQRNNNLYFYVADMDAPEIYDHGEPFYVYGVPAEQIDLLYVDLQEDANELKHHTDRYDPVVFRRGSTLSFNYVVSPGYNSASHYLSLRVSGPSGVQTAFPGNTYDSQDWYVEVGASQTKDIYPAYNNFNDYDVVPVKVYVPFDAPIGEYQFEAILKDLNDDNYTTLAAGQSSYIIFNPWSSRDDDVYMADAGTSGLGEYVLNKKGVVYKASYPLKWNYYQFDSVVFETVMSLVENISVDNRRKAWMVLRYLSAYTNSQDDNGLLVGNWSGDYSGGRSPQSWSDSKSIFREYENGSVKYGQCWVFAALLNSMSRSIGIPCRPVTNMGSAHDTSPYDGIIYIYRRTDGEKLTRSDYSYLNNNGHYPESIWNFHVWNEAWTIRPDRNDHSGAGWQAFDGTPQERSDGLLQCGPAPVSAIFNNASGQYDITFIRNEVQANVFKHSYNPNSGTIRQVSEYPYRSEHIYTKDPQNPGNAIDIVDEYCSDCTSSSASVIEKETVGGMLISKTLNLLFNLLSSPAHAQDALLYHAQIHVDAQPALGGSITGSVDVTNIGTESDTVEVKLNFSAQSSNGEIIEKWNEAVFQDVAIAAGETVNLPYSMNVPVTNKVIPGSDFYLLGAVITGANGIGFAEQTGSITGATVDVSSEHLGGDQFDITATMNNSLPITMNNVVLTIMPPPEIQTPAQPSIQIGTLDAGQNAIATWTVTVPQGDHNITVRAEADGLMAVYGNVSIENQQTPVMKMSMEVPEEISINETENMNLLVQNTGGGELDTTVNVKAGYGLGDIDQHINVFSLQSGQSMTEQIPVTAMQAGIHSITASGQNPISGEQVYTSTTIAVTIPPVGLTVALDPGAISIENSGEATIQLTTSASGDTNVSISSIASSTGIRYEIYDGSQKITNQSVVVPTTGKSLTLKISDVDADGWIQVNATVDNNPAETSSSRITVEKSTSAPSTVDDEEIDFHDDSGPCFIASSETRNSEISYVSVLTIMLGMGLLLGLGVFKHRNRH